MIKAEPAPRLGVGSFEDDDAVEPVVGQDSDGDGDALAVEAVGAMELRILADDAIDAIGNGQVVIVDEGEVCLDGHGRGVGQLVLVVGAQNRLTAQDDNVTTLSDSRCCAQ